MHYAVHTTFTVFNTLFTLAAVVMLAAFFWKRQAFILRERIPSMVLLQLGLAITVATTWYLHELFPPASLRADCLIRFVLGTGLVGTVYIILGVRITLLFRRFYLGNLFKAKRQQLRHISAIALQSGASAGPSTKGPNFRDISMMAATHPRMHRVVKLGVLAYYAFAVAGNWVAALGEYFAREPYCDRLEPGSSRFALLVFISASNSVFMVIMGWKMRNFHDNFNIGLEFKRIAAFVAATGVLLTVVGALGRGIPTQLFIFCLQGVITISGFIPLYEQHRLERNIVKGDFTAHTRLDELMQDPAALISFRKFLLQEFAVEVLEFYEAVEEYQRMYALETPLQQIERANIIYASFLSSDAPSQVNISSKDMRAITREVCQANGMPVPGEEPSVASSTISDAAKSISQSSDSTCYITSTVFDRAQREMRQLMTSGPFTRFQVYYGQENSVAVERPAESDTVSGLAKVVPEPAPHDA